MATEVCSQEIILAAKKKVNFRCQTHPTRSSKILVNAATKQWSGEEGVKIKIGCIGTTKILEHKVTNLDGRPLTCIFLSFAAKSKLKALLFLLKSMIQNYHIGRHLKLLRGYVRCTRII